MFVPFALLLRIYSFCSFIGHDFMQSYKLSKNSIETFTFQALNVGTYEGGNNIGGLHLME
jgi:hypothetical protein